MSLPFSNTTTKRGILQTIEDKCGFNDGDITGNTLKRKKFTAKCNDALDAALKIIFRVGGTAKFDDSNHDDYNIIYLDLVSGQDNYSFLTDSQGNLILEIDKVFIKQSASGPYVPISPVDTASEDVRSSFYDQLGATGIPSQYDKTGNGILLDVVPSVSITSGIKIYIAREGSYFDSEDTTKKPGFDGLFHNYIPVYVAHDWGRLNLPVSKFNALEREKLEIEKAMEEWYGQKEKDVRPVMRGKRLNPRTGRFSGEEIN